MKIKTWCGEKVIIKRLLRLIGIAKILVAIFNFMQIQPYLGMLDATQIILNILVWFGVGITEIVLSVYVSEHEKLKTMLELHLKDKKGS